MLITLDSGIVFDFTNMFGAKRISEADLNSLKERAEAACIGVDKIRREGVAKAHLSKDGSPEPVYFTRLPFVSAEGPNTPAVMEALQAFEAEAAQADGIIFFGIGGSYLGAKVLYDVCGNNGDHRIFFSGNNMDAYEYERLWQELHVLLAHKGGNGAKIMLVPVSKSGTTMEPSAAFLYFYGRLSADSRFAIKVAVLTQQGEEKNNPLQQLAGEKGWQVFDIPDGIGGRFSVLSSPGLVAAAALQLNIAELLRGAADMEKACGSNDFRSNPALLNALLKYIANVRYGVSIEVMMPYAMRFKTLGEWYCQLLAESLGKRLDRSGWEKYYGRMPVVAVGSTDMHSQTQLFQEGPRDKVIQFVEIGEPGGTIIAGNPFPHIEAYGQYAELDVDKALKAALYAHIEALSEDNRFNARYYIPKLNEYYMGALFYFLELSIAYEGELADVDAYDQPGVEVYKRIMKELLKKK